MKLLVPFREYFSILVVVMLNLVFLLTLIFFVLVPSQISVELKMVVAGVSKDFTIFCIISLIRIRTSYIRII